ncbi:hypothetical protein EZS27_003572 [termite gut metagenome]|uniref:Uncharacterized protein n=1 Tax=termite gut metagenome TaxID=433724 RepID=A0A5J4SSZ8_9ZZZZ
MLPVTGKNMKKGKELKELKEFWDLDKRLSDEYNIKAGEILLAVNLLHPNGQLLKYNDSTYYTHPQGNGKPFRRYKLNELELNKETGKYEETGKRDSGFPIHYMRFANSIDELNNYKYVAKNIL